MENASKALIIAGAILLAILIISLGILILGQANDVISNSGMTQAELQAFNQKFTKYEESGSIKGSTVRSLVQEVLANNNSSNASDETYVSINKDNGTAKVTADKCNANLISLEAGENKSPVYGSGFSNTKTYSIECGYKNGRVAVINIK